MTFVKRTDERGRDYREWDDEYSAPTVGEVVNAIKYLSKRDPDFYNKKVVIAAGYNTMDKEDDVFMYGDVVRIRNYENSICLECF